MFNNGRCKISLRVRLLPTGERRDKPYQLDACRWFMAANSYNVALKVGFNDCHERLAQAKNQGICNMVRNGIDHWVEADLKSRMPLFEGRMYDKALRAPNSEQ